MLRKGSLDACFVILIWSGFILVSRMGGRSELSSYDVVALRFGVATLVLFPLWVKQGCVSLWQPRMLALGLVGGIFYAMLAYLGFKHAPAAHASILLPGLLPFEIAFFTWLLLGERPSRTRMAGLSAIALGVASLAVDIFLTGFSSWLGDAAFIGCSLLWAFYTVLVRKWKIGAWDATIASALISAAIYLPVYWAALPHHLHEASWNAIIIQGFYQGVMAAVVAMVLYMRALKGLGPSKLGLCMALIPAISGLAAVPILGEPLTLPIIAGLLLTSAGAWIGSRG